MFDETVVDPNQEIIEGLPHEVVEGHERILNDWSGPLDAEAGSEADCSLLGDGDADSGPSEPAPSCEGGEMPEIEDKGAEPGMTETSLPDFRIVPKMLLSQQEQGVMVRSRIKALEEQAFELEVNMWEAQVAGDSSEVVALRSDVVRLVRVTEALAVVYNQKYGE